MGQRNEIKQVGTKKDSGTEMTALICLANKLRWDACPEAREFPPGLHDHEVSKTPAVCNHHLYQG